MSTGFRHHAHSSGYIAPGDIELAESALLSDVKIDRKHDVPFCAGMSEDGSTLYIDKEVPKEVDGMDLEKTLIVHEMVEHLLMDKCGLKYDEAHYIATAAEEACVRCNGWDVTKYNKAWDKIIRQVSARGNFKNVPQDLDTAPYAEDGTKEEKDEVEGGLLGPGDDN